MGDKLLKKRNLLKKFQDQLDRTPSWSPRAAGLEKMIGKLRARISELEKKED